MQDKPEEEEEDIDGKSSSQRPPVVTKKPPATAPQQDGFFITEDLNQAADEANTKKRKGSEVAMVPQSAGSGQGKL